MAVFIQKRDQMVQEIHFLTHSLYLWLLSNGQLIFGPQHPLLFSCHCWVYILSTGFLFRSYIIPFIIQIFPSNHWYLFIKHISKISSLHLVFLYPAHARTHARMHACTHAHTHTHTHPFNGPLSGTTRVSWYQKCKTNLVFTEARDSEWQWHQLGHMQVCTSLQTDNHASSPPLSFLQAGCPSCHPTNSVKALSGLVLKNKLHFE